VCDGAEQVVELYLLVIDTCAAHAGGAVAAVLSAHPHWGRMLELRGLVRDGVRYTRSGGRRRGGAHEGGAPAQGSGRGSDNKGRHHHDQEEVLLKSGKTTGSKGSKGSKSKSKRGKGPKKVSPGPEASSNAANEESRGDVDTASSSTATTREWSPTSTGHLAVGARETGVKVQS
jgi:hypothetical protein